MRRHMERVHREEINSKELNGSCSEDQDANVGTKINEASDILKNVTISGGMVVQNSDSTNSVSLNLL